MSICSISMSFIFFNIYVESLQNNYWIRFSHHLFVLTFFISAVLSKFSAFDYILSLRITNSVCSFLNLSLLVNACLSYTVRFSNSYCKLRSFNFSCSCIYSGITCFSSCLLSWIFYLISYYFSSFSWIYTIELLTESFVEFLLIIGLGVIFFIVFT